jgi:hypothetical protein
VTEVVAWAAGNGDRSENADYQYGKRRLRQIDGRIRFLTKRIKPRRSLPGMLLHIDGSRHRWFQGERWYDLIVILDDASSEIHYAQLVEEESTVTVLAGLKEVVERKGVFCAPYSDRGGHFWLTPKVGGKVDPHRLTQAGPALRELGVQMIPAYSPQARGRSESTSGPQRHPAPWTRCRSSSHCGGRSRNAAQSAKLR